MTKKQQTTNIKRARDFYLYDEKGIRKVDFCLGEGSAVFGHRFQKLHNTIKQSINKGYLGIAHSQESVRVIKHLNNYILGWDLIAILYNIPSQNLSLNYYMQQELGIQNIYDLVTKTNINFDAISEKLTKNSETPTKDAMLWRVFSAIDRTQLIHNKANFLCTIIPINWGKGVVAVYKKKSLTDLEKKVYIEVSMPLLAGINYIIPRLIQQGTDVRQLSNIAKNRSDIVIVDSETTKHSKHFTQIPLKLPASWKKQGIYIVLPQYSVLEYLDIRKKFFDLGFYFPECNSEFSTTQHSYIPRFLTIPSCMTLHEITQWEQAIETI